MNKLIDEGVVSGQRAKSFWFVSKKYGLFGAICFIGLRLIFHFLPEPDSLSSNDYERERAFAISLMILSFFVIASIKHLRDKILNWKIDYKTAFKTGFTTTLILSIIVLIFNYVYFAYIIRDVMQDLENSVRAEFENTTQMNEKDKVQASYLADIYWNPLFFAFAGSIMLMIQGTFISAIAALFMKR